MRWGTIHLWTYAVVISVLTIATTLYPEWSVIFLLALGGICFGMHYAVKPWYDRRVQRHINASFPATDLDS